MSNANNKVSNAAIAAGVKITKVPAKAKVKQTPKPAKSTKPAKSAKPVAAVASTTVAPKCGHSQMQVGKLQRRMLTKITWIGKKPEGPNRLKRWDNYKVGMTLQDCKTGENTAHLDIGYYVERGFMKVAPATDKEYEAALAKQTKAA